MDQLKVIFGNPELQRTLLYSLFYLITFVILLYFYFISADKKNVKKENRNGLFYMAILFLIYAITGIIFAFTPDKRLLFLLAGCYNICYVLILPFFSRGNTKLDKLSERRLWKFVAIFIGLLYCTILITNFNTPSNLVYYDLPITCLVILIVGIFLVWEFERRNMMFIGYLIGTALMMKVLVQIFLTTNLEDKFDHVNLATISPAIIEALVAIAMTFNWFSELRFQSLAKIYSDDIKDGPVQDYFDKKQSKGDLKKVWKTMIAKNDAEKTIQSIVMFLEKRNQYLEVILNIASRNNRNNTGQMKGILTTQEYSLSRNKIMDSLLELIERI